jgi:hypothetical protein
MTQTDWQVGKTYGVYWGGHLDYSAKIDRLTKTQIIVHSYAGGELRFNRSTGCICGGDGRTYLQEMTKEDRERLLCRQYSANLKTMLDTLPSDKLQRMLEIAEEGK